MLGRMGTALSMEAIVASFVVTVLTCLAARQFIKSRMKNESDPIPLGNNGFENSAPFGILGAELLDYYTSNPAPYVEDAAFTTVCDTILNLIVFVAFYGIFTLFGIRKDDDARRAVLALVCVPYVSIGLIFLYMYSVLI